MPNRDEILIRLGECYAESRRLHREIAELEGALSRFNGRPAENPLHRDQEHAENPLNDEGRVLRPEDLPDGFRYFPSFQKPGKNPLIETPAPADEDLAAAVAETLSDKQAEIPEVQSIPPDESALAAAGLSPHEIALIRAKRRGDQFQATPIDPGAAVKPFDLSEPYNGNRDEQAEIEARRRQQQAANAATPRTAQTNTGGIDGQLKTRWKNDPATNGIRTRG